MSEPARRRRVETVPFESQRRRRVDTIPLENNGSGTDASGSAVGRLIGGKYAIERVLGDGSCGTVYRAKQLALDKDVAIKVLHREMSMDPAIVERFHREARAASRLDHPSSIRVFDFGQERDGLLYLVMEYVEGRDLLTVMNEEGPLEPRRIAIIMSQVLAALAVAHDQGIVHRDLKPENILVTKGLTDDGEQIDVVKVCDFGIAALATPDAAARRLTARGLVVGTPEYMSPEQARGLAVDGRTDLYAVGVVLYQLLASRVPFSGSSPVATAIMHVNTAVTAPSELVPSADPFLEDICLRALSKNPDDRYPNARQMRAALREMLTARGSKMPPLPSLRPELALPAVRLKKNNSGDFGALNSNELQVTSRSIEPESHSEVARPPSRVGRTIAIALALVAGVVVAGGYGKFQRVQQQARLERVAAAAAQAAEPAREPTPSVAKPAPAPSASVQAAPSASTLAKTPKKLPVKKAH